MCNCFTKNGEGKEKQGEGGIEREREREQGQEMGTNAILWTPHQHSPEEIKLPPVWLGFSTICIVFKSESQTLSYFIGVSKEALQSISETQLFQLLSITKKSLWRSRNLKTARGASSQSVWTWKSVSVHLGRPLGLYRTVGKSSSRSWRERCKIKVNNGTNTIYRVLAVSGF